ncbi:hypothetical protein C8R43DRAFT_298545 [Mycena crocata]|nr:hypothetical protein C8R43DRAFT_298545 [Mycena crocata]
MSDLHEVHFTWPSPEPSEVVVTGTFDQWSSSVHLVKNDDGFHGSTRIPWDTKIAYKYVVDSNWVCENTTPTETDAEGNVNNVYTSPPQPLPQAVKNATPEAALINGGAVGEETHTSSPAAVNASSEASVEEPLSKDPAVADFADTVAARDGTSSALGYVTSALGAVIHSQIGVDPINGEKIGVETPKPDGQFVLFEPTPSVAGAAESLQVVDPMASPIAPVVAMPIVPVNAEVNNTFSTEAAAGTPDVSASKVLAELQPPAVEAAETPSTHEPLPTPSVVPETPTHRSDPPSAPAPSGEVAPNSESKAIEAPAPSEPLVAPTAVPTVAPTVETAVTAAAVVPEATLPPTTASVEPAAPSVAESPKPATNGGAPTPADASSPSTPVVAPAISAPATPAKNLQHAFPSSETESPSSNKSPSKFGTVGSRKNRKSIFGKIKGLFGNEKEEKEKK